MNSTIPSARTKGLSYIRHAYGVPAKRGGTVEYLARGGELLRGTICGANAGRLRVRLGTNKHSTLFHPTYRLNYIGAGGDVLWRSPE